MPALGLGTAAIGRPQYINIRQNVSKKEQSLEDFRQQGLNLLEAAYQGGIRYFDTAPGYGMAEQLLHDWLQKHPHDDVELATKWGYKYVANFDPNATVHEVKEHSIDLLNTQWSHSQTLLPELSTLQIHSATFETGVLRNEAVLDRLQEIKNSGINVGLSTTGANQTDVLKTALAIEREGEPLFEVFQVTYNMLDQSLAALMPQLQDKRVVIKEALSNGRIFPNVHYPQYTRLYEALDTLAKNHDVGIDAIALRYAMDSIQPFMVLSGAAQAAHLNGNLKVHDFVLSASEVDLLSSFRVPAETYWDERKQLGWN